MNQLGKKRKFIRPNQNTSFLIKLYTILNEEKKYSKYIHWCKNGFIITNSNNFTNYVLPNFFNHRKFSSFVRQLNLYDFHKVKTDKKEELKYIHEQFSKDKTEDQIKSIKKKPKNVTQIKNTDIPNRNIVAPDFNFIQTISNDLISDKSIKIEKLDEPKIYEFKNIIQQSDISKITNQKILNYLLDYSLQNINYQKKLDNEINNLNQLNNELIKQIQICHNVIINQNNNSNKMKTYILKLLLNKYKFNNKVIINKNNNKIFDNKNNNKIIKKDYKKNEKFIKLVLEYNEYIKEKKLLFGSQATTKTIEIQKPENIFITPDIFQDTNHENQYDNNLSYLSSQNRLDLELKLTNSKNNFNSSNNFGEPNLRISRNNSRMNLSKIIYNNLNNSSYIPNFSINNYSKF